MIGLIIFLTDRLTIGSLCNIMEANIRKILGLPYKSPYFYWQHYWGHCIDKLMDKYNVSFKIIGPRMLLRDLIDELEGQGLSNQENIDYFKKQISILDKSDEVLKSLCHPIIACLLQRLGDKINKDSNILLCKKMLNTLVEKQYFTNLIDWLAKTIDQTTDNNYNSRKRINDITHLVIAEFVAEGFVLDEIRKYATDIPEVAIAEGGIVMAAPPEFDILKESDFPSSKDYYDAVSELIKNRNVFQSLDVLKKYYYTPSQKAYFIVRLNGLKGQIDDYIGDINIYSPKLKRYITEDHSLSNIESITNNRDRVNAAVPIDFRSIDQAKVYANSKLEEVLDILMLTYQTANPVTVATNIYAAVVDGKEIGASMSSVGNDPLMASRDEMMKYIEALDLTNVKEGGFKFLSDKHHILEVGQGALKRRLKNACHWYSKAIAADKDVDVLLYSWFAIEGLLKVHPNTQLEILYKTKNASLLKVVQEFVTSIICKRYFQSYLRNTYRNFLYFTNQNNNYYDITEEVIIKAGLNLNIGDTYRDGDFLNTIPDMVDCVNDDIVKDELTDLQKFYQNANGLMDKTKQLKDDLLMIYRLRNMIVHNAALSCVNITFYANEAKYIAQQVIWYIIDKANGDTTIDEIVLSANLDYQVFLENFEQELNTVRSMGR